MQKHDDATARTPRMSSDSQSTAFTGGPQRDIRDVVRVRGRSEYPARSRGRWIISRLSRPRAGTEPSIFLFPSMAPWRDGMATPAVASSSPLFFFSSPNRGVAEGGDALLALSDIPRPQWETTLEDPGRVLARGIHPVGREMHAPRVVPRPTDWWNSPRQGWIFYSLMDETFGFLLQQSQSAILELDSWYYYRCSLHEFLRLIYISNDEQCTSSSLNVHCLCRRMSWDIPW